jgi:hypothetical protein
MLLVFSVVYLAAVFGVMLWRGVEIEPEWVVLALLLIAVATGRGIQFLKDWAPFLVLFIAYEAMSGFASQTGFRPMDTGRLELALFHGTLPTVWLQSRLYSTTRISPLDWATMCAYFLHFVIPLLVGFVFWMRSRALYWRFISALMLLSFLAFLTYLFFPSAPPWYQFPHEVHKVIDATIRKWGVSYYVSPVFSHLNPNQFAAFPSLHASYPVLCAIYAWRLNRRFSIGLFAWSAFVWFSIVYLGEHYVVDALASLAYIAVTVVSLELVLRRWPRLLPGSEHEGATAPVPAHARGG